MMASARGPIGVSIEAGQRKVFAWAIGWPGWCRSGKDEASALEVLAAYAPRYAAVVARAAVSWPADAGHRLAVTERLAGSSGTDFGVPGQVGAQDRRPVSTAQARQICALVAAAWAIFDEVAASAPASLRKGPRGGGRDRDKVVSHVTEADHAYAREMGLKSRLPEPADQAAVRAMRDSMLEALSARSDGSPLAGRRWPPRYAARRISWHVLDHAWEIEDRS